MRVKIRIDRKELLAGIQRVQGVVERRNTMPILMHILMEAKGDRIALFATDLEVGIQGSYPAEVLEPGSVTLSARKLHEIVREFPEGEVSISAQENYWVVIESGKSYFRIVGLPPEEFPVLPPLKKTRRISLGRATLSGLIKRTFFAIGENDPKYILNAVMIQVEKKTNNEGLIRFITTDGHRLAIAEEGISGENLPSEEGVILPKKAVLEIKRALDDGEEGDEPSLSVGENQLTYRQGNTLVTSRLLEGEFPNYKQAIPSENNIHVTAEKLDLEGGLRRVSILAREKTSAIKFALKTGGIELSATNPEMGEAREEIPASFEGEGFSTGFNARYLLDALSGLRRDEATFEFKDGLSPCLLREASEGFLAVIMPMRV